LLPGSLLGVPQFGRQRSGLFPLRWVVVVPPIQPILAKLVDTLPAGGGFAFELKWDGFRAVVFRLDEDVYLRIESTRTSASCRWEAAVG
jgi:hypothetical protein